MKYVINAIAIFLIIILIFTVIQLKSSDNYPFRERIKNFFKTISQFINTLRHNIGVEMSPSRKPKLTYIEAEEVLRQYAPAVFGEFSNSDWQKFWAIIYQPIEKKQGKFRVKTYRTKEEVEEYLIEHYSNPFGSFRSNNWIDFWNIARVNWESR